MVSPRHRQKKTIRLVHVNSARRHISRTTELPTGVVWEISFSEVIQVIKLSTYDYQNLKVHREKLGVIFQG
jgi:hypothetical protein